MADGKKPPEQPLEVQDIMIFDFDQRDWVKGYRKDIEREPDLYELHFTNITTTNKTPDVDTAIDIEFATSIAIQVDSTESNNTSTDTDLNVIATVDGGVYDDGGTRPYREYNFGDAVIETFLVTPGPKKIKLRMDENGSLRADVTVKVLVRY